jgi:histidinol-phosphatase
MKLDLEAALDVARRAVKAGGEAALRHFGRGIAVEHKSDASPVTAADRASEAAILAVLRAAYPEHAIVSEESGELAGAPGLRWIIDPVDGTKGFIRGLPFWGPLVALEVAGRSVVGASLMPVLGENYYAARGLGCFDASGTRLSVSKVTSWPAATMSLGELPRLLARPEAAGVLELVRTASSVRTFGDVAAPALVLTGRAEAYLEAGVQLWDLAAHAIMIEEAGGRFTNFAGENTAASGCCVASNGLVHEDILKALR